MQIPAGERLKIIHKWEKVFKDRFGYSVIEDFGIDELMNEDDPETFLDEVVQDMLNEEYCNKYGRA